MKQRSRQVSFGKIIFFFGRRDVFFLFPVYSIKSKACKNGWKDFQEMNLIVGQHRLSGEIAVPGSKSHTIRAVALAMMAEGGSRIHAPLVSEDSLAAVRAASLFGASVERGDDSCWSVTGTGGKLRDPGTVVDMANSGTSVKIFAGLAALSPFPVTFDGDASLRSRPMGHLLSALDRLNVKTSSRGGKCPFSVEGPMSGGETVVNGESSQYVTALLLSAPFAKQDTRIHVENINEQPYIEITLGWLDRLSIRYKAEKDLSLFEIPGGQSISPFEATIPADFSTATFPLVAAAVTGSELMIRNLDFNDLQGDKAVFALLERMGMEVLRGGEGTLVRPRGVLQAADLDLNATPDALPAIAVAAAFANGTSRIYNVAQARIKETDRIACMTRELRRMGVRVEEFPDGMTITGGVLHGAAVNSYKDHRIAMALAVAGLGASGETIIRDAECVGVTYPKFMDDFNALGARFRIF